MNHQHPLIDLSVRDLKRAIKLKERIATLQSRLPHLLGGTSSHTAAPTRKRWTMSAARHTRIAAAALGEGQEAATSGWRRLNGQ